MHEILMGFSLAYWPTESVIEGVEEISNAGFPGFEGTPQIVDRYEDRLEVFHEILEKTDIELVAVCCKSNFLIAERLEEEIEIDMNVARFLHNVGAQYLLVTCGPRRPEGNSDEDWKNLTTALAELGTRALDASIQVCVLPTHGTIVESRADIGRLMTETKPETVFLAVDLGELRAQNIPAKGVIDEYTPRLKYVRFRDVLDRKMMGRPRLISKARKAGTSLTAPIGVTLGTGLSELVNAWDALNEREFEGWTMCVVEEPRGAAAKVVRDCRKYLENNMELIF
ncbi:MAG: TIM barrel protein [Candidatus Brocadiia bacterium]